MMIGSKSNAHAPSILPNADPASDISTFPVPTLQAIYREYFDFVWSSARHLGATRDAIDDVVQDVFIVIHYKLATLQRPEALRSWIYGIVRRTVSDYRRSRRTRDAAGARLGTELKSNQPSQPSPLDMAERNAELELLESVLAELDEPRREVFVMVEVLEMTVPEVVQVLEIPLNTAYSRLRLARQSFEEALARHEARDEENRRPCRP
jgi:RNA polymerase sigma-70 factor, ECF subfamily